MNVSAYERVNARRLYLRTFTPLCFRTFETRYATRSRQRTNLLQPLKPLSLVALLLLTACGNGDAQMPSAAPLDSAATVAQAAPTSDTSKVQVEDFKYTVLQGDARVLTGQVYNPTDKNLKNVQIRVSLFDANNRRVSEMSIAVKDVEPGKRRSFRQHVDSDMDIQGAKVVSLIVP